MKPLVSLTGHISSFFELLRVTQDWAVKNGEANDRSYGLSTMYTVMVENALSVIFSALSDTVYYFSAIGVESDTARSYVSSFYTSLASSTVESKSSFSEMREEAATPGGLNEQSLRGLSGSEHFELAEKVSLSSTNHYITHILIYSY